MKSLQVDVKIVRFVIYLNLKSYFFFEVEVWLRECYVNITMVITFTIKIIMMENIDENSDFWWVQEFIPKKQKFEISKKSFFRNKL